MKNYNYRRIFILITMAVVLASCSQEVLEGVVGKELMEITNLCGARMILLVSSPQLALKLLSQ